MSIVERLRKAGIVGLVALGFSIASPGLVHAADPTSAVESVPLNLTLSPTTINLSAAPGATISTDIRVKNNGSGAEQLRMGLLKFGANNQNGEPVLSSRQKGDDFLSWISFSSPVFSANPGEWKTVTLTLHLPKTAAFGYYYAVAVTRASQPIDTGNRQIGVIGAPSVLVLLAVNAPGAKREAEVVGFSSERQWYEFLPATFTVTVKGTGNVHVVPKGDLFISRGGHDSQDGNGQADIAVLPVNDDAGNVLPNSTRQFSIPWQDGFPRYETVLKDGQPVLDKHNRPKEHLVWHWNEVSKFRFGHYTADLTLIYDNGKQDVPINGTLSFWVIPWRILAVLLLVLLFIGLGFQALFRRLFGFVRR